ncbi:hypothetical protein L208DRAFT_1320567, partial [Tricholoma matsutake]
KEANLEANLVSALESISVETMHQYARCSHKFMDAYYHGLDGKQAAWAAHKYRGHRVLPECLMNDLEKAKLK